MYKLYDKLVLGKIILHKPVHYYMPESSQIRICTVLSNENHIPDEKELNVWLM